jgi:hypothetical protein
MFATVLGVFAHRFLHFTATLCLLIESFTGLNPQEISASEQPPTAILLVDDLEQTLRDLGVEIDVQSFIEKVNS